MKKVFSLFTMAFISMFILVLGVSAAELSSYIDGDKITLTSDAEVSTTYTVPNTIKVIDLNGKTLTLKKGINIASSLEIKNGTIVRDTTFTSGSMIKVDEATANFKLDGVTIDGKDITVLNTGKQGSAILVNTGKDITLSNSEIVNHKFNFAGIVSVFNAENVYMINTEISNNTATNVGTLTVAYSGNFEFDKDSVVSNNIAKEAAGIHIEYTNAVISGTIEGNKTTATDGNGGGLYVFLNDQFNSNTELKTVTITESAKIINNIALGAGGGVYITGVKPDTLTGKVVMTGGLISGNTAKGTPADGTLKDGGGAGIYVARGNMEIQGGVIENNTSTSGIGNAILVSRAGQNSKTGNLEITGGTVDGEIAMATDNGEISISGGAFTDDITEYVSPNTDKTEVDGVTYVGYPIEIELEKTENGKVTLSHDKAIPGQPVKVTVEPNKGYKLSKLVYINGNDEEVEIKDGKFIMPNDEIKVKATFVADVKVPNTGDNAMIFMVLGLIGLVGAAVTTNKLRHN